MIGRRAGIENKNISLICPNCSQRLLEADSAYKCFTCLRKYPVSQGVVCFLGGDDVFYEGAYDATVNITFKSQKSLKALLFFHIYREPYFNFIKKYAKTGSIILDIGCGGGTRYLTQKGQVVGLDLSFSSLKKATGFYKMAVQANALKLPFPNDTFDLITSGYLLEHFSPEEKPFFLSEINRVLKPEGRTILIFDCDNNNPLFRWFKKDKQLYQRCIVEHDHHYGLQKPSTNLGLIENAGFSILQHRALNKTPFHYTAVYGWMEPYKDKSRIASFVTSFASFVRKRKFLWVPYHSAVNWLDGIAERLLPLDYARILLVALRK